MKKRTAMARRTKASMAFDALISPRFTIPTLLALEFEIGGSPSFVALPVRTFAGPVQELTECETGEAFPHVGTQRRSEGVMMVFVFEALPSDVPDRQMPIA